MVHNLASLFMSLLVDWFNVHQGVLYYLIFVYE